MIRTKIFAVAMLSAFAGTADAAYLFKIKSAHNGHFLTAEGDHNNTNWNNQPVRVRPENGTDAQLWWLEWATSDQLYIRSFVSGRLLDIHPASNMATTHPRTSAGHAANQLFNYSSLNLYSTQLFTMKHGSRACLDVYYLNSQYGPEVGTWSCHSGKNQIWSLVPTTR
jgi:hypothetical protein